MLQSAPECAQAVFESKPLITSNFKLELHFTLLNSLLASLRTSSPRLFCLLLNFQNNVASNFQINILTDCAGKWGWGTMLPFTECHFEELEKI